MKYCLKKGGISKKCFKNSFQSEVQCTTYDYKSQRAYLSTNSLFFLSTYLFVYLLIIICLFIYLLSVYLSVCLSIYCLSIYLSIYHLSNLSPTLCTPSVRECVQAPVHVPRRRPPGPLETPQILHVGEGERGWKKSGREWRKVKESERMRVNEREWKKVKEWVWMEVNEREWMEVSEREWKRIKEEWRVSGRKRKKSERENDGKERREKYLLRGGRREYDGCWMKYD